jgi:hypothetical protein
VQEDNSTLGAGGSTANSHSGFAAIDSDHGGAASGSACNGKARAEKRGLKGDGITPRLLDFITRYGLNENRARRMQLREVKEDEAMELVGDARAGVYIPFFGLDGKLTDTFQIRFYPTPPNPNGFQVDGEGSRPKYRGPAGITPVPYFSPFIDWKSLVASTDPIYSVEGPFAAALLCTMGLPTFSLIGCWGFKSKNSGQFDLLDGIKAINLRDRDVRIAFDSDAATKPQVMGALHGYARAMANEGARPSTVAVPKLPDQKKTGPDDFILARGIDAFKHLPVEKFSEVEALWELNEDHAVLHNPPSILVLEDGTLINPNTFSNLLVANKQITQIDAKGNPRTVPAGPAWLRWPRRREHKAMVYEPGQPTVLPNNDYNTWTLGCQPRPGDVTPWHRLMEHLLCDKPLFMRQWFERWIAYPLQCPGTKQHTAVVVYGATQGSGKSITGDMIRGVYGDNAVEIDKSSLSSNFNSYIAKRQFITSSDISERKDLRLDAEKLKVMITRPEVEINCKYAPSYFLRDCVNWYFSSNYLAAVYAEDTDRRYFFVHVEKKLPTELSDPLRAWRNKPDGLFENYEGFGPLLHYFLYLDLGDFDPRAAAPLTPDRDDVIDAGRSDLDTWCQDLKADPMSFLRSGSDGFVPRDLWRNEELLTIHKFQRSRDVSEKALVNAMRKAGFFQTVRLRTYHGRLRVWAVQNIERWRSASETELAECYNSTRSKGAKYS